MYSTAKLVQASSRARQQSLIHMLGNSDNNGGGIRSSVPFLVVEQRSDEASSRADQDT